MVDVKALTKELDAQGELVTYTIRPNGFIEKRILIKGKAPDTLVVRYPHLSGENHIFSIGSFVKGVFGDCEVYTNYWLAYAASLKAKNPA